MERVSWDDTWMACAYAISRRSKCSLRQVGAVIVDRRNRVVATGYNGPPAGLLGAFGSESCRDFCPRSVPGAERGDYGNCVSIHAEMNAIAFADRREYEGGTLYVTASVCWDCAKVVANAGLSKVIMHVDMSLDAHREPDKIMVFLAECGLEVVKHDITSL